MENFISVFVVPLKLSRPKYLVQQYFNLEMLNYLYRLNELVTSPETQNKYVVCLLKALLHEDIGCGVSVASHILKLCAKWWLVVILCALATSLPGDQPLIPVAYEARWTPYLSSA